MTLRLLPAMSYTRWDHLSYWLVGGALLVFVGGSDFVDAGRGDDQVHGGSDDDMLFGGDGDDFIWGDNGDDDIDGGDGNDWLLGGLGLDSLSGGCGFNIFPELRTSSGEMENEEVDLMMDCEPPKLLSSGSDTSGVCTC